MTHSPQIRETFAITTTDPARRRHWQRLFGRDTLPVRARRPRWVEIPGLGRQLAYDLDLGALHPGQVYRLAAHVARRLGWPYETAVAEVERGWPIRAAGCTVIDNAFSETADAPAPAVSFYAPAFL